MAGAAVWLILRDRAIMVAEGVARPPDWEPALRSSRHGRGYNRGGRSAGSAGCASRQRSSHSSGKLDQSDGGATLRI